MITSNYPATLNGTNKLPIQNLKPLPTGKDDYLQKHLERRYYEASGIPELIEVIELARQFRYKSLAEQMVNELEDAERELWNIHNNSKLK